MVEQKDIDDDIYICAICRRELPLPPGYCGIEPPLGFDVGGWFCLDCLRIGREFSKRYLDLAKDFSDKRRDLHLEYIDQLNALKPPSKEIIDFFKDWQP